MPGAGPSVFHRLGLWILTNSRRQVLCLHFADEKTEAQRIPCLGRGRVMRSGRAQIRTQAFRPALHAGLRLMWKTLSPGQAAAKKRSTHSRDRRASPGVSVGNARPRISTRSRH